MKSSSLTWGLVGVSILLAGIALAFTSGYWLASNRPIEVPLVSETPNEPSTPVVDDEPVESDGVAWYPLTEQIISHSSQLKDQLLATAYGKANLAYAERDMAVDSVPLGVMSAGAYKDYVLHEDHLFVGELGGRRFTFYWLSTPSDTADSLTVKIFLSKYSDFGHSGDFPSAEIEEIGAISDMSIAELEFGKETEVSDGQTFFPVLIDGYTFTKDSLADALAYPIVGKTADGRDLRAYHRLTPTKQGVFYGNEGGIFTIRHDGHVVWYDLELSFWPHTNITATDGYLLQSSFTGVPVVMLNSSPNSSTYLKGVPGGCGFSGIANVVEETSIPGKKVIGFVIGKPEEKIYGADYTNSLFDQDFTNWNRWHDDKMTRDDFARSVPTFYYYDAFGRWLKFMNADITPPGECGKPVIYLYPTETMDVTVNLEPQGGFTKSEPEYGNGWEVTALPDGTLVNKADGKTYPYLFWEGRGGLYQSPDKYWVVAKEDVEVFLKTTLAKLGLNEKETADFMEFWYPRMQSAPYYKIGFYGTDMMDTLAPMSLSTNPDTIIRVLMDYQELSQVEPSNPPTLGKALERKGFTVLEWGGVLR